MSLRQNKPSLSGTIKERTETLVKSKDNMEIFLPKGNLHKSSYRKLDYKNECTGISETQAMLSQIKPRNEYKSIICPRRSLFMMQAFLLAKKEYEEKDLKLTDILLDPTAICCTDYYTVTSNDYRLPYPLKPRSSPLLTPPPELCFLNRRIIGYSPQDLENRCGFHTFLDDNLNLHKRIAELKIRTSKLY